MQELDLKTQDTTKLLMNVNQQFGCAMRVHVQLYNGEYVDAEFYNYTKYTVLSAISELSSGSVCTIRELYDCVSWDYHDKERQQLVRNCAMHLAVTREANLKFFMLERNGDPSFYVI
jgi:hypothetical protein